MAFEPARNPNAPSCLEVSEATRDMRTYAVLDDDCDECVVGEVDERGWVELGCLGGVSASMAGLFDSRCCGPNWREVRSVSMRKETHPPPCIYTS